MAGNPGASAMYCERNQGCVDPVQISLRRESSILSYLQSVHLIVVPLFLLSDAPSHRHHLDRAYALT